MNNAQLARQPDAKLRRALRRSRSLERERLALERDAAEDSQAADIDEILLSCDKAAEELKQAYLAAFETYDNLPAYADLVERGESRVGNSGDDF